MALNQSTVSWAEKHKGLRLTGRTNRSRTGKNRFMVHVLLLERVLSIGTYEGIDNNNMTEINNNKNHNKDSNNTTTSINNKNKNHNKDSYNNSNASQNNKSKNHNKDNNNNNTFI